MKKRILSLLLALLLLVGLLPTGALAASSLEDAMKEVSIYAKNDDLKWLTMNGAVKTQHYTYYRYRSVLDGSTSEIPAYCVDPYLYGVPALVPEGTAIRYTCSETVSDPKVCGIIANGYPHIDTPPLIPSTVQEFYGTRYFPSNFSVASLFLVPASFSSTVTGALATGSGNYISSLLFLIPVAVLSFGLNLTVKAEG